MQDAGGIAVHCHKNQLCRMIFFSSFIPSFLDSKQTHLQSKVRAEEFYRKQQRELLVYLTLYTWFSVSFTDPAYTL